ncbi:MAG: hypothetical protein HYV94_05575 [Candidatus Rokubacteria bacterium]|nr:hypothetical protein [Candidatus Rokubacteria bacterium]
MSTLSAHAGQTSPWREFYARLAAEAPGDALRGAQRQALRQFPHPFAWAVCTLTGAPW